MNSIRAIPRERIWLIWLMYMKKKSTNILNSNVILKRILMHRRQQQKNTYDCLEILCTNLEWWWWCGFWSYFFLFQWANPNIVQQYFQFYFQLWLWHLTQFCDILIHHLFSPFREDKNVEFLNLKWTVNHFTTMSSLNKEEFKLDMVAWLKFKRRINMLANKIITMNEN